MKRSTSGFTIVELLIVIVVIVILASLTVVVYDSIQKRANEVAILSDMRAIKTAVEHYQDMNGTYPHDPAGSVNSSDTSTLLRNVELPKIKVKVSSDSYRRNMSNGLYLAKTDGTRWAYLATPKDGIAYYISDNVSDPTPYTAAYPRCFPGCSARDVGGSFGMAQNETSFNYVFTGSTSPARFWAP